MPASLDPIVVSGLFGVGIAAGYLNVVAGGGSLLAVPMLIFFGLPDGMANATSRLAILMQSTTAIAKYRAASRLDLSLAKRLVPPTVIGALLGAFVATRVSDALFRAILAWVMIGCAAVVVAEPLLFRGQSDAGREPRLHPLRVWITMLAVGFYGGMVQAGMGYVALAGLTLSLGLRLIDANVLKMVLVFAYTPFVLAVFISKNMIHWPYGVLLSAGQALGGYLGATHALSRGEGLVRAVLALVVMVTAVKLLWFA